MKQCLIGIDMGSTNTKAIAVDLQGRTLAYASRRTETYSSRPGFYEYDFEQMWGGALACLKETAAQLSGVEVCAIGVSSLGETSVLVDADGAPLHRAITWFDLRATAQAARLGARVPEREVYRITGQFLSPKFGVCKLMWTLDEDPSLLRRAARFLSVEDYVLYRLSGAFATDYSIAARSLCFDRRALDWSEPILSALELPASLFPQAFPGGTVVGGLSREVAEHCGLSAGIPVCTGGHDHACALVSSGAYARDAILDSTGTAETTICAVDAPVEDAAGYENGVCSYPHFGRRLYRAIMSSQACGASVEWFLRVFGAPGKPGNVYAALFEEAASVGAGDAPLYVPYLRGLQEKPGAAGAFMGLKDAHGRAHMARAIAEGICFAIRDRLEHYEAAAGRHYDAMLAVGGLAQSDWFMGLKADIMDRRVEIPGCTEAAALGAAQLAGMAVGALRAEDTAALAARPFEPSPDARVYGARFAAYRRAARFMENEQ